MLLIYLLMICNVSSISYYCDTATDCDGETFTSNDNVYARGYKSLFEASSPQQTNTNERICSGALSCKNSSYIRTNSLHCYGVDSCSNIGLIEVNNNINTNAANSLMYSNISLLSGANLRCDSHQSCSHSEININNSTAHSIIYCEGSLSLSNTTINILQGNATIHLRGYYSGFASTIYCKNGSHCNIYCYYNGCGGLILNCDQNVACHVHTLDPNTNVSPQYLSFLNSSAITKYIYNEEKCSLQTDKTFDINEQHLNGEYIYFDEGHICCRAQSSCQGTNIFYNDSVNSITIHSIICSGKLSCSYTTIESNSDINIECSGYQACKQLIIFGANNIINGGTIL
eukprot:469273_1